MALHDQIIDDVSEIVGAMLKKQRVELIQHMQRLAKLSELRTSQARDDARIHSLFKRVTELESQLRRLRKSGVLSP